ncbi:ATP-dependent zinc protease family protein [Marinicella meishanensis]|uniref:ATP-dependent zinc protease family protein n=1 Tax=Marinicella meishanensis TaxID=2873263 RepID=UPI001CBFA8C6|nr:RimK/LysX family protein [Marinicella sp. NBU2979]
MSDKKTIEVGWKEYGALPDLGVDRIHIKIDTGARTSAIHTLQNKPFKKNNQLWVRFTLAPHQDDDDTTIECELPIKDQRTVTSSNGQTTDRIVVESRLVIGGQERLIEITLVCRQEMRFRMLLGRQAMAGMIVRPDRSHLTTKSKGKKFP